jgi:histidinol-phosphate/aromatic aminotransferase/cobyric acid decarboxylase-like protein
MLTGLGIINCASAGQDVERIPRMEETTIDQAAMKRLAKSLVFVCGPDHPTTVALQRAAESGSEQDIKKARTLFLD